MGIVIDSCILIDVQRGKLDLAEALAPYLSDQVALSSVTVSELLYGVIRSRGTKHHADAETFVEGLVANFPILSFDESSAREHAEAWVQLDVAGDKVGERDLMIGATALANGHGVLTKNQKDFDRIPGLVVAVVEEEPS